MIQFEPNKNARIHWQVFALTENELKKLQKVKDLEVLFNEFKNNAVLDKQIFSRKRGLKTVLCHIGKRYMLTMALRNYEGTYHGKIYINDDKTAKSDFLAEMKAISNMSSKFMGITKKVIQNMGN